MKKPVNLLFCLMATTLLYAQSLTIHWELVSNDSPTQGIVESALTISNQTSETLTATGDWLIGYCWMSVHPYSYVGAELQETEVCASYHTLRPTADFQPLHPGESRTYRLLQKGAIIRESAGPQGAFFVAHEGAQPVDAPIVAAPFTAPKQWMRSNQPAYASGEWLYAYNQEALHSPYENADITAGNETVDAAFRPLNLVPEPKIIYAAPVQANLQAELVFKSAKDLPQEGYRITFLRKKILIDYADENGRFYALQTIERLRENVSRLGKDECPYVFQLQDWPDLHHRGLMLDIARNYTSKEEILKLLSAMAAYKMNVFHFHLADDEGWRLEIPGLPELTEVGARRGFTLDEHDRLYPAYGGGWNPEAASSANGFLTREDYIEIVRYADSLHIRVIPEIDMPGHSRAAIRAMEERYRRLMAKGMQAEAEQYRLIDPNDSSVYSSAQYYTDDVICIARPSCYVFVYKIIDEIGQMHQEAGQPLKVFHVGGDEVANGAFEGSPLCQQKMRELGYSHTYQLKDWFLQQLIDYLQPKGIQIAGWEEIAMRKGEPNPLFADKNVLSWCWNSIPEWRGDEKPYLLANAGYPVILACVGNNYIDMSYTNHQSERGLHWGGYTDERSTFDFLPYDIYRSVRYTLRREKRDIDAYDAEKTVRLLPEAVPNIIGINGQLFSETLRSNEQTEQYIFPKLQGLAERGWNATPLSVSNGISIYPRMQFEAERIRYFAQLYQYELPRIHEWGIRFHLAQPGIHIENGMVFCNHPYLSDAEMQFDGLIIRYTTNGTEPSMDSEIYSGPFMLETAPSLLRAKAYYLGEESATTFYIE